jgi:hypothetical protein
VKITRLPMRYYDLVACSITLLVLTAVAWQEYRSGCPMGWWLGVLWFVGLGVALVWRLPQRAKDRATV